MTVIRTRPVSTSCGNVTARWTSVLPVTVAWVTQSEPFQVATVKSIGTPSALDRTVMPGSLTGVGLVICSQAG